MLPVAVGYLHFELCAVSLEHTAPGDRNPSAEVAEPYVVGCVRPKEASLSRIDEFRVNVKIFAYPQPCAELKCLPGSVSNF